MIRANTAPRLLGVLALLAGLTGPAAAEDPKEGVLPVGADGKPLNLDFETGTLKDWTADGDAFRGQPVEGDLVAKRRGDMKSRHQGRFWVGGYERAGDKPQGTLTSAAFKVTHPWASFLVGGGSHRETCVELVAVPGNEVIFRAPGVEEEDLRRVAVDLTKLMGREMQVRLFDRHTGHWGHVNFDDFRFHATRPDVPPRKKVEPPSPPDDYKFAGLTPQKAAAAMTVPEGFTVTLFAGEPDVHQPVAMCLDDRGRLWVAEAYTYPRRNPHPGPVLPDAQKAVGDRILVFEDADGDGRFDRKTTFLEGLNLVSGLEVGFGGVWIGAAPYFLFVPDRDGDDKPDGPPEVLLDGWGYQDTHETLNSFIWGPDGWLYGCHGVFTHSRVGKPGTPDEKREPINAGVWRYHPTRHEFEVFAHGTSNPWGLDFNDVGEAFVEACVIPHCFHIIQGGRYHRQGGVHFNPHTYADIATIADHRHYLGPNPHGGNNRSDSAGGGHAHCGLMCYLGGAWPKEYRGQLFMGNIHGRRFNMDVLKAQGSGYVAGHGPDFLLANDEYARFINLRYGPDGNVYFIDWYDKQACHRMEPEIWDRTNGRVYKVSYRGTKPAAGIDLSKRSNEELVKYQLHDNDWYVRHARRLLQERAATRDPGSAAARSELAKIATTHADESRRLRALWALHVTGGLPQDVIDKGLEDWDNPHVRGWTVRLALEQSRSSPDFVTQLESMACLDKSPVVRRYVASAAMRMPVADRAQVVANLLARDDAADPNLPLLYWYAAEPLAGRDPEQALTIAANAKVPQVLPLMARRVGSAGTPEAIGLLVKSLGESADDGRRLAYLRGIQEGLKGRRQFPMPAGWPKVFEGLSKGGAEVRSEAFALSVTFGDPKAFEELRRVVATPGAKPEARLNALNALVDAQDKQLAPVLQKLVGDAAVRGAAIRGLASFDDAKTPEVLLTAYAGLGTADRRDVLNTLASRPAYAKAMLEAIAAKRLAAADVSADVIRQLRNLNDKDLEKRIGEVWGLVRSTPADRAKLIADYRNSLTAKAAKADVGLGRAVYVKTCAQCHTLFSVGGTVGPDITGANRANLDYILENILDPSALIPKEYAATLIELKNGRVVTGIVKEETKAAVTVVTANETLTIPLNEIESRSPSTNSMMPDDLLKPLSAPEVRALVAYLQSPSQVPLLATAENAKDLFNGKDLTGWDGDPKLWSVADGEIVGKSPGVKRNSFLKSHMSASDFRLSLKVKLVPDAENSGIQFRSEPLPDGEMRGPQADAGKGWWGKLYEESGRGLLWKESGEKHVRAGDWNDYVIEAVGPRLRTWINGQLCVDLTDDKLSRQGVFGLQVHSGGPMEVRFKDLKLEVIGPKPK